MQIEETLMMVSELLNDAEKKQLEAGRLLQKLVDQGYATDFLAEKLSISRRKIYNLLMMAKAVSEKVLTAKEASALGVSRVSKIVPHLKNGMPKDKAIGIALSVPSEQVGKALKGEEKPGMHVVIHYLNDDAYDAYRAAMLRHGAEMHGSKGLRRKEAALLSILTTAMLVSTVKKAV